MLQNPHIQATIEAIKELSRLAFFAALAAVAGYLTTRLTAYEPTSLYYIILTALLRVIDRFIHTNSATRINGLAPF